MSIGAIYAQPHLVAYVSFWMGVLSSGALAAVGFGVYRMTFIKPDNVFKQTLSVLLKDERAQKALGYDIKPCSVKSYEIKDG